MATKQECLKIMKQLTELAREQGRLMQPVTERDMYLTPDEVDRLNLEGRWIWANRNSWVFIEPAAALAEAAQVVRGAQVAQRNVAAKVERLWRELDKWKGADRNATGMDA